MPVSYEIDKQNGVVLSTGEGVVTLDDVLRFRREVARDPDFDPSFSQLGDLSTAISIDLTTDEIRMLAETSPFSLTARRAFVGDRQEVFELARMFSIFGGLRGDRAFRVFRRRHDALAWLLEKRGAA
jgi:hypothetical protein